MNKMQKKIFNFENHIQDQIIEILQQLMLQFIYSHNIKYFFPSYTYII